MKPIATFFSRELRSGSTVFNNRGAEYLPLTDDKISFGAFLRNAGLPTPEDLLIIAGDGAVTVPNSGQASSLASLKPGHYFAKPVDAACGRGASAIEVGAELDRAELHDALSLTALENGGQVIIQQLIRQHPALSSFNPDSVNTLRIVTMKHSGFKFPSVAHSVLRIGRAGSSVDNAAAGGVVVRVKKGKTYGPGVNKVGGRFERHPDTGVSLHGQDIPFWNESVAVVLRAHALMPDLYSAGWDVAITPDGPLIVEANWSWDHTLHSMTDSLFQLKVIRDGLWLMAGSLVSRGTRRLGAAAS